MLGWSAAAGPVVSAKTKIALADHFAIPFRVPAGLAAIYTTETFRTL